MPYVISFLLSAFSSAMQRNFGISRGVGTAGRSSNELRMQKLAHNCRFPCSPIFRVSWHGRKGRGKLVETFESFPDSCSQRQRFLGEILINHPGNWSLSYRVINSGKTRGKGRRSKMTIEERDSGGDGCSRIGVTSTKEVLC